MAKAVSFTLVSIFLFSMLSGCIGTGNKFVEYDIDDANQVWDQYDEHYYIKRTPASNASIGIADKLINNNEIFLLRYWDSFVYDEDEFRLV